MTVLLATLGGELRFSPSQGILEPSWCWLLRTWEELEADWEVLLEAPPWSVLLFSFSTNALLPVIDGFGFRNRLLETGLCAK